MEVKQPSARSIVAVSYPQEPERRIPAAGAPSKKIGEGAAVEIEINTESGTQKRELPELNRVINVVNVVADATEQISDLVDSLGGIAAQIQKGVSPQYEDALTSEAQGLVEAIKRTAQVKTDGSQPLYGDPIRVELEQQLGKTLDLIFPDVGSDALGLDRLSISPKEFIINTQAGLAQARQRLEELRKSVQETVRAVREIVNAYEVARQNNEAAKASIPDVDQALKVAFDTRATIGSNPAAALRSVGKLTGNAIQLLE